MGTLQKAATVALAGLVSIVLMARDAAAQIVVGQTADLSSPAAASVAELNTGARLLIDSVNRSGGVHGQPIKLVQMDDRNDPALAPLNARYLIERHQAQVLFLSRGTPHTQALLPLLSQHGIALVAPSTGAMVLRQPPHPLVFNVRASYQRESERAVQHLATLGLRRIAVLRVNDSFGADAAEGALRGFAASHLQPLALETFDRARPDLRPPAERLAAAQAQAVLIIGSGAAVAQGIQALREAGSRAQVVTLSNNASHGFVRLLGPDARGVVVTQVFPSERALATMWRWSLGGLELDYTSGSREGIRHVDLSIIDPDGRFRR